jgi:hypothetical protein
LKENAPSLFSDFGERPIPHGSPRETWLPVDAERHRDDEIAEADWLLRSFLAAAGAWNSDDKSMVKNGRRRREQLT